MSFWANIKYHADLSAQSLIRFVNRFGYLLNVIDNN